ncbi:MAG: YggT family protein [Chloroflexi bacterium]|nr:YggT family protein [Chloroflexota bacterium]
MVLSWINLSPTNPLVVIINQITEPILAPIRRVLPKMGMIDLSPMVALIIIIVIQRFILRML